MHLGLSKLFFDIYKLYKLALIDIYTVLFGFEFINGKLQSFDKRLLIPVLRKYGARIGDNCDIEVPLIVNTKSKYENLVVGNNCYIGKNVVLDLKGGLEIGDNVTISFGTILISHFDVGNSEIRKIYDVVYEKTIISDNVFIGANSTILFGVHIGEYSVVGAGAVVTTNVEPYSVVAGVPAGIIKKVKL